MTGLIRLLLLVFVAFVLRLIFYRLFGQGTAKRRANREVPRKPQAKTISGQMVKDPQCGTYVASELAIPLRTAETTLHFCSQNCLEEFRRLHPASSVRVSAGRL